MKSWKAGIAADGATFDSTYHHPESGYVLQLYYGDLYLYKVASGETELDSDTGFNASYTTYYVYRLYISSGVVYGNAGATALAAKVQANDETFSAGQPLIYAGYGCTPEWDWIDVRTSHLITCTGMTDGYYLRVSDGTTTAEAAASGGTATVRDAGLVLFPLTNVQIRTASGGGGTLVEEITNATLNDMGGGDVFEFSEIAAPILSITKSGANVTISWTDDGSGEKRRPRV